MTANNATTTHVEGTPIKSRNQHGTALTKKYDINESSKRQQRKTN